MRPFSEAAHRRTAVVALFFLFLFPFTARGEERVTLFDLLDAPLSYEAAFTFATQDRSVEGTVYHVPGKERRVYQLKGEEQILLLRRDRMQAYWILPSRRVSVSLSLSEFGKAEGGLENMVLVLHSQGEELSDGVVLRRFSVETENPADHRFSATIRMNPDNVIVRAEARDVFFIKPGAGGELEMTNLQYKPLDDSLFEVPEGYLNITLKEADLSALDQMFSSFSRRKKTE